MTSWSILRFQATWTLPTMTKVLMCLFIVCETKFTIGESRTTSHANFPPKLLWNENAHFKFSVNNE